VRVVVLVPWRIQLRLLHAASGQRAEALGQTLSQKLDVLVSRRRQWREHELLVRPLHEQSVEEQAVEVRIKIQNTAEPLYEGHGPGLAVGDARPSAPQALPCEDSAQEDSEHLREELAVHRQEKPELPGEGQHPLPVWRFGQDTVHQMGRGVRCLAGPAGGAEPALAGKRHEPLEPARRATDAGKAPCQDAAAQVAPELVLDKLRIPFAGVAAHPGVVKKGLQVVADDGVQRGRLGCTSLVVPGERSGCCARLALEVDARQPG